MHLGIFEPALAAPFTAKSLERPDQDSASGFLATFDQLTAVEAVAAGEMQDLGQADADEDIGDDADVVDINAIAAGQQPIPPDAALLQSVADVTAATDGSSDRAGAETEGTVDQPLQTSDADMSSGAGIPQKAEATAAYPAGSGHGKQAQAEAMTVGQKQAQSALVQVTTADGGGADILGDGDPAIDAAQTWAEDVAPQSGQDTLSGRMVAATEPSAAAFDPGAGSGANTAQDGSSPAPQAAETLKPETPASLQDIVVDLTLHVAKELRAEPIMASHALRLPHVDPREVTRQISEKLAQADQNRVEITLSPEELGKVRLIVTPGDTPSVAVYAENRDTLELLRRHADLLGRELRDAGMSGASLHFGDSEQSDRSFRASSQARQGRGEHFAEAAPQQASIPPASVSGRQIDMRI
ncbi:flagellar hook-length control protein FliK [Paracoccus shanxieyensis]|uniref:Flagellar hook-length control protein-like C-terminal domain-containing protein n=1 Tax=Paracoccus shanxieyensis TaxID=2675752 RepID=A0A6L6IXN7_9RHOB|nr:flagellar hook-length control protein FliK [Paracoccus shanxieyensis]MTH64629.1 hypothetical protein [Paracoccus shanxieyensis]MTH87773.1 hypothetical protein [Paracoccus shanxieyensis]